MKRTGTALVFLSVGGISLAGVAALGCSKKGGDAVLAGDAGVASAKNEKDVKRFGDEAKLDNVAAKLTDLATARDEPPRGEPIANLTAGYDVQKIATHDEFVLIAFTNPKSGDRDLGWVPAIAFRELDAGAAAVIPSSAPHHAHAGGDGGGGGGNGAGGGNGGGGGTGTAAGSCSAGHVLSQLTTGPKCMKSCVKTADCGPHNDCVAAPLAGQSGKMARVCFDQNDN